MSKLKFILFFWVCLAVPAILAKPVKYCDKKNDYAVKVEGIEMKPDPVQPGKEAVFSISASSGELKRALVECDYPKLLFAVEALSGGKVTIDVSYFGIHVHSETIDLCKETSCPISPGDFVLSHKQTLPFFTPWGSYTLKMRMSDSKDQLLTCISFGFSIGFGASVSDS